MKKEYDDKNTVMSASEAVRKAKKEIAGNLKPITKAVIDRIKKKAKTKEQAEKMARDEGYDPSKVAGE